jgi:hypothetical protein
VRRESVWGLSFSDHSIARLIASAVKEITRWATPLMHIRRTAMKDVEIGGRLIRKGDKVVVWYNSANREEAKWPDSSDFDVGRFTDRGATAHIAFGSGPHHCLGWRAAELQIKVALEELLNRLPDFRVTEPARILRSNFIGGIKELNIAFTPDNQLIFSHHPFYAPDIRVAKLTSPTTFEPFPSLEWNTPRKGSDQYLDNVLGLVNVRARVVRALALAGSRCRLPSNSSLETLVVQGQTISSLSTPLDIKIESSGVVVATLQA